MCKDRAQGATLTGFQEEADAVDEGAGAGHHLRGGQQAPRAGQLQGQAAAVQARLQVHTQRDLLVDQVPGQCLEGRPTSEAGPVPFLPPSGSRPPREASGPQQPCPPRGWAAFPLLVSPSSCSPQCPAPLSARTHPDPLRLALQRGGLLSAASLPHTRPGPSRADSAGLASLRPGGRI